MTSLSKEDLAAKILDLRVVELKSLLRSVGKNINGLKNDLQGRAIELVTEPGNVPDELRALICALYRQRHGLKSVSDEDSENVAPEPTTQRPRKPPLVVLDPDRRRSLRNLNHQMHGVSQTAGRAPEKRTEFQAILRQPLIARYSQGRRLGQGDDVLGSGRGAHTTEISIHHQTTLPSSGESNNIQSSNAPQASEPVYTRLTSQEVRTLQNNIREVHSNAGDNRMYAEDVNRLCSMVHTDNITAETIVTTANAVLPNRIVSTLASSSVHIHNNTQLCSADDGDGLRSLIRYDVMDSDSNATSCLTAHRSRAATVDLTTGCSNGALLRSVNDAQAAVFHRAPISHSTPVSEWLSVRSAASRHAATVQPEEGAARVACSHGSAQHISRITHSFLGTRTSAAPLLLSVPSNNYTTAGFPRHQPIQMSRMTHPDPQFLTPNGQVTLSVVRAPVFLVAHAHEGMYSQRSVYATLGVQAARELRSNQCRLELVIAAVTPVFSRQCYRSPRDLTANGFRVVLPESLPHIMLNSTQSDLKGCHVDISHLIKGFSCFVNLTITWVEPPGHGYVVGLNLYRKVEEPLVEHVVAIDAEVTRQLSITCMTLFNTLSARNAPLTAESVRGLCRLTRELHELIQRLHPSIDPSIGNYMALHVYFRSKFCADEDLSTTNFTISLMCPLTLARLTKPCRAVRCTHLQCFDAVAYISMNVQNSKWKCPLCKQDAPFADLRIDSFFTEILAKESQLQEVEVIASGSWRAPKRKSLYVSLDDSVLNSPKGSTALKDIRPATIPTLDVSCIDLTDDVEEGESTQMLVAHLDQAPVRTTGRAVFPWVLPWWRPSREW